MNNDQPFLTQFFSTPPITRSLSALIVLVIVCVYIKLVSPYTLMYSPHFLKTGELWRIFTCFLYFGNPSLDVLIHITFLYRYSRMLEEGFIFTSDYFWLVFIISSLLFMAANLFSIPLLASAFSSTITYIWTRRNPNAIVQIFGFISFPAFYLPFIVPLFMLVTEKRIMTEDLLGIVVGHLYFFFKDVYPKWGSDIFRTPCFVKKIFGEHPGECCKAKKYRTLNLNNERPSPAMETIILDEPMDLEDTINLEDTIMEQESKETESGIKSEEGPFDLSDDIPKEEISIQNEPIENSKIEAEVLEKEKEWEENWSSETVEDNNDP